MSVNGITGLTAYENNAAVSANANQSKKADEKQQSNIDQDTAVVYEKQEEVTEPKKLYQRDQATIDRLLEDAERRAQSLRDLVERMLLKQGQKLTEATDIYGLIREGKLEVDPETRAQAQRDIAEDGYWGVEQTSERLVSFAKALAGGDPEKADLMIDAVKKGFEEATKAWGDELPDISKRTLEATLKKLEAWRDSGK